MTVQGASRTSVGATGGCPQSGDGATLSLLRGLFFSLSPQGGQVHPPTAPARRQLLPHTSETSGLQFQFVFPVLHSRRPVQAATVSSWTAAASSPACPLPPCPMPLHSCPEPVFNYENTEPARPSRPCGESRSEVSVPAPRSQQPGQRRCPSCTFRGLGQGCSPREDAGSVTPALTGAPGGGVLAVNPASAVATVGFREPLGGPHRAVQCARPGRP